MTRPGPTRRRIPPNLFAIPFGVTGLAGVWRATEARLGTPPAVADSLSILAAALWVAVLVVYASNGWRRVAADLEDRIVGPFVPLAAIVPLLLAATLAHYSSGAGRALVVGFAALTVALGGWMTGQWMVGDLDIDSAHPGYFLPTVAGGLVASIAASQAGFPTLARALFGIGILCWLVLGALLLVRLFFRPQLPAALTPTLAIELAPPVVAGIAYNALSGGATDTFAAALAGYAVLMGLVQIRLLPVYLRLRFTVGFWAFTFSYAAAGTDAVEWIAVKHPVGAAVYSAVIAGLISVLVAAIAARSLIAVHWGQFWPPPPADPAPPTLVAAAPAVG